MKIEKCVQKRILKALSILGGTAKTSEIMEKSKLGRMSVHRGCFNLINRALVKKHPARMRSWGGYDESIFSLREENPRIKAKINRLIAEAEEDGF